MRIFATSLSTAFVVVVATTLGSDLKKTFTHSITISYNNHKFSHAFHNSSGWGEGSEKYSVMAETEESRNTFAESVLKFLAFYGFDGVNKFSLDAKVVEM